MPRKKTMRRNKKKGKGVIDWIKNKAKSVNEYLKEKKP